MEHYDGAPESPPQNRRQFLLTIGSSVAAGVITADLLRLARYSSVWRTGGHQPQLWRHWREDLGHASADPASPASYNRNFSPTGNMVLDSSC